MIIDLNNDINSHQLIRVGVRDKNANIVGSIEFSFSKEALMGFAKNLIWMYEDISPNRKFYVCTDPLGGVPSGSQVLGFYLTAHSPILTFNVNSLDYDEEYRMDDKLYLKAQPSKYMEVPPPLSDCFLEDYELKFRNIVDISLYDKNHVNISDKFYEIFFDINYEGLKNLAIMLMKLGDCYQEGKEYIFKQIGREKQSCDLGISLTCDSLPLKIKLSNLGSAYDYEPDFGKNV